ncbi:MAG: hypothetical protein GX902_03025 [Lentisphaerae bacterium]|nr:hypothetical protein [Lentisphaerota bacterium]
MYAKFGKIQVRRERKHLYDVRKGEYLGHTNKYRISLVPGDAVMLALLPYKVTGHALTAPASAGKGEIVKITAAVQSDATPAHNVLLLTVRRPDGAESLEYRAGQWQIQVKDAASGTLAQKTILLQ